MATRRSTRRPTLALALSATTVGGLGYWWIHGPSRRGPTVDKQVWIERMPRSERDQIRYMVLTEERRQRVGVRGKGSQWRQAFDVVLWDKQGDAVSWTTPQDGRTIRAAARVWRCRGEAPAPFELCLELTTEGGERELWYSRAEWRIDEVEPRALPVPVELDGLTRAVR